MQSRPTSHPLSLPSFPYPKETHFDLCTLSRPQITPLKKVAKNPFLFISFQKQNQSSVAAQSRHFPLRKPGGFHWDFFLLGVTSLIAGILGLPLPNGLVPQAPVHTECMTEYRSELKVIRTVDDDDEEEEEEEGEKQEDISTTTDNQHNQPTKKEKKVTIKKQHQHLTSATLVHEQRLSHLTMGLLIVVTMTGPLLTVLHLIPRALFAGVFFVVGWGGLEGNGIMAKIIFLIREPRFVQPEEPLLKLKKRRVLLYVCWQVFGITATLGVSQTIAAIGAFLFSSHQSHLSQAAAQKT